jgi:quinol monooxygenase YgiN
MFLWNPASALSLRSNSHTIIEQPVHFSLMVTLQFTAAEYKEQFLREIQPEADYVKANEPGTLAYNVLLSDQDPLHVMVLERYQDKEEAYLQIHKSSTPFLAFRPKLQAMQEAGHVTISGHSYLDSGVGFGDRA